MSLEQHTVSDRSDHEVAKSVLRRTLVSQCIGKQNAMSGRELAERTPVSASTIRDLIGELRRQESIPVYSLGSGYFVIESKPEFAECIERIEQEIETREQTKRELYRAVME